MYSYKSFFVGICKALSSSLINLSTHEYRQTGPGPKFLHSHLFTLQYHWQMMHYSTVVMMQPLPFPLPPPSSGGVPSPTSSAATHLATCIGRAVKSEADVCDSGLQ